MTYRQMISDVRSDLKLISSDILIPDRFIMSELRDAANLLVIQSLKVRKLWQSPNIFTPIRCIPMEKVPISECCDYTSPRNVAKSKFSLPKIGEGVFGLAIQMVTGLDDNKKFVEVTPMRYANLLRLKLVTNDIYYWMYNQYLYVSNPDTEATNLFAYFTEDIPNDLLFPGGDCDCKNKPSLQDLCTNPYDKNFWFPSDRIKDVKDIVVTKLSATFLKLKQDVTSDNKEDN